MKISLKLLLIWFLTLSLFAENPFGQEQGLSLGVKPKKKTSIFGIEFGSTIPEAALLLKKENLKFISSTPKGRSGRLREILYKGVPKEISVQEGNLRLFFMDNQLVGVNLEFSPSYQNFMRLRHQIFASFGSRFILGRKQESIDSQMRSKLVTASKRQVVEQAVLSAIRKGTAFFHYEIEDRQQELDVFYAFKREKDEKMQTQVQLTLHYSIKNLALEMPKKERETGKSILPMQ